MAECLIGKAVDYLTVTIGHIETIDNLLAESELSEYGHGSDGFKKSEKRIVPGGFCWRRTDPSQASKLFGLSYESWRWPGSEASWAASRLRGEPVKPSLVDVAFDFQVDEEFRPEDFMALIGDDGKYLPNGLETGKAGRAGVYTCYVGAATSDRRIKIYRKDLQNESWAVLYGPTLRVEATVKGEVAVAWWGVWAKSQDDGFAAAAAHILDMTGFNVGSRIGEVPEVVMPEQTGAALKLVTFLKQYGDYMTAVKEAGIDLDGLARYFREGCESRWSECRRKKLVAELRTFGVREIESLVKLLRRPGGLREGEEDTFPV